MGGFLKETAHVFGAHSMRDKPKCPGDSVYLSSWNHPAALYSLFLCYVQLEGDKYMNL